MSGWIEEDDRGLCKLSLKVTRRLYEGDSPFQHIEVVETAQYGRVLSLDGVFMTSERDEFFYHELLNQPAMCAHPGAKRLLLIGGGDGGSARELLRHRQVERLDMVEIDAQVVEVCKAHLPSIGTAWADPRLSLHFEDGVAFSARQPAESYDVIIVDGSDPVGPAEGLFSAAFFAELGRLLKPDGLLSLQSESPFLTEQHYHDTQAKLRACFPEVHPYFGPAPLYGVGMWSWTICSKGPDPRRPIPERAAAVEPACRYYSAAIHEAAFALPRFAAPQAS